MRKRAITPALFLALVLVAVIVMIAGSAAQALAHSFYPWECCHDRDCWMTGEPGREPDPTFTRDGWRLHDGTLVPFAAARPSPDGRFHVCRSGGETSGALIRPNNKPPCLWVPQGAS